MTPKEKAIELAEKIFNVNPDMSKYCAIKCALIAVDEIIEATKQEICRPDFNGIVYNQYWLNVRLELLAL
jgi:hypothetical protein